MDRWTRNVAVGAEDAAIALQWAQHLSAMAAVIEELASIGRHRLFGNAVALRAGERGGELGHAPPSKFMSGFSRYDGQRADNATNRVASESITSVVRVGGATAQVASAEQALRFRR